MANRYSSPNRNYHDHRHNDSDGSENFAPKYLFNSSSSPITRDVNSNEEENQAITIDCRQHSLREIEAAIGLLMLKYKDAPSSSPTIKKEIKPTPLRTTINRSSRHHIMLSGPSNIRRIRRPSNEKTVTLLTQCRNILKEFLKDNGFQLHQKTKPQE